MKEKSYEMGGEASGSLQSDANDECLPKIVAGTYEAGTALVPANNYIEVQVDVLGTGAYKITTDTVNGMYFIASGVFTSPGLNSVKLKGNGTPALDGISNFVVTFDSTVCDVAVTVLPNGAGGPAEFTLTGAPAACMNALVSGTYVVGSALTATNSVDISVNVTKIGTYNVTTTAVNGMTFKGQGTLGALGSATITLIGQGNPVSANPAITNIPVKVGTSECSFPVTVIGAATFTMNCAGATVNGTYKVGTALTASNTITLPVNVTSVGGYSISGTASGMTFTASGTFTSTGNQNITLNGVGNPTGSGGNVSLSLTGGAATCNVTIVVTAGTGGGGTFDWKLTVGSTTFQGTSVDAVLESITQLGITVTTFDYEGDNTASDNIEIGLIDVSGGIKANETYSTSALGSNSATFRFSDATNGESYEGIPGITTGTTLTFKVTSHNTSTKKIIGTFSGTVEDGSGASKTITNGQFQGTYQ